MMNKYHGPVRCDHLHFYGDPVDVMKALHVSFAQAELKIWEWARLDFQIEQVGRELEQIDLEITKLEAELDEMRSNPYALGVGPAVYEPSDYSGMFDNPFEL
jgi:hypothetical protein